MKDDELKDDELKDQMRSYLKEEYGIADYCLEHLIRMQRDHDREDAPAPVANMVAPEQLQKHIDELSAIVARSEHQDSIRGGQIGLWLAEEVKRLNKELAAAKLCRNPTREF